MGFFYYKPHYQGRALPLSYGGPEWARPMPQGPDRGKHPLTEPSMPRHYDGSMTDHAPPNHSLSARPKKTEEKQRRLATALRENLKKRKRQEKARATETKTPGGDAHK